MRSARFRLVSIVAASACCTQAPSQAAPPPPSTVAAATSHDVSETASDRVVTDRIRTLFREDFEISAVQADVAIATRQSVVTLSGRVHTERQRLVMAAHARATEGVTSVESQLALAP